MMAFLKQLVKGFEISQFRLTVELKHPAQRRMMVFGGYEVEDGD